MPNALTASMAWRKPSSNVPREIFLNDMGSIVMCDWFKCRQLPVFLSAGMEFSKPY